MVMHHVLQISGGLGWDERYPGILVMVGRHVARITDIPVRELSEVYVRLDSPEITVRVSNIESIAIIDLGNQSTKHQQTTLRRRKRKGRGFTGRRTRHTAQWCGRATGVRMKIRDVRQKCGRDGCGFDADIGEVGVSGRAISHTLIVAGVVYDKLPGSSVH